MAHPYERNFKQAYLKAEREMQETMEAQIAAILEVEISRLGLDPADPAASVPVDDAVTDLGPRIQRDIDEATYQGPTRRFLTINGLARAIGPRRAGRSGQGASLRDEHGVFRKQYRNFPPCILTHRPRFNTCVGRRPGEMRTFYDPVNEVLDEHSEYPVRTARGCRAARYPQPEHTAAGRPRRRGSRDGGGSGRPGSGPVCPKPDNSRREGRIRGGARSACIRCSRPACGNDNTRSGKASGY